MKTVFSESEGVKLLQKAITFEKDASRYYGQYVKWVVKYNVPVEVITEQLVNAKGWTIHLARRNATSIKLLGENTNAEILEALLTGEISLAIALMRVNPITRRKTIYNDEETAIRCIQKAILIMTHRNRQWTIREFCTWVENIYQSLNK